jgi:hypothetical protein
VENLENMSPDLEKLGRVHAQIMGGQLSSKKQEDNLGLVHFVGFTYRGPKFGKFFPLNQPKHPIFLVEKHMVMLFLFFKTTISRYPGCSREEKNRCKNKFFRKKVCVLQRKHVQKFGPR